MPSQADLLRSLKTATTPTEQRDRALELLAVARQREAVDTALRVLEKDEVTALLNADHRPQLRDKALYYYDSPDRDHAGLIREKITRLLVSIGHPDDADLYQRGVDTYDRQPTDTAQNLRAVALVGLAAADSESGCAHAVRLLGEPDTSEFNGEPSLRAVRVLAHYGQYLPLYQFVLRLGKEFAREGKSDVVGAALEALGESFCPPLFARLAEQVAAWDEPVSSSSLILAIITQHNTDLYPLLEQVITGTRHDDLHRYGVLQMAAARDKTLTALLYDMARTSPQARIMNCLEAVELTTGSGRDDLIAALERRL